MVEVDPNEEGQKCHPENNTPSELEAKIVKQLEYYYGDINISRDKFLQEQIKLDNGWVPLETMVKFSRLAQLSTDFDVIANAIKKSQTKLIEVSEDNKKIRRSPEVPIVEMNEEKRKEMMERTLYMKGFDKEKTELGQLLDFFPKFGNIDNVIMRKYHDKATKKWEFKGSVFVVFSTKEEAENVLKLEDFTFQEQPILKKWQADYLEDKRKERLEHQQNRSKGNKEPKPSKEKEEEPKDDGFYPGTVVRISGINNADISRDDIKSAIEEMGFSVAYVEYSRGDEVATARLEEQDKAKELIAKVGEDDGKISIKSIKFEIQALEKEEEEEFLNMSRKDKALRINKLKHPKNRRGGRGGGRRNMGGFAGRKRKGGPIANEAGGARAKLDD